MVVASVAIYKNVLENQTVPTGIPAAPKLNPATVAVVLLLLLGAAFFAIVAVLAEKCCVNVPLAAHKNLVPAPAAELRVIVTFA